ncbi:MAG: prepilin peptidase [Candidatus Saganbacteria bacterium]|nr:prepilin peptidase [Candidatus Saganbacteria bacterium]
MFLFEATAVIVLGLVTGSFINVCVYRLPRCLSIVYPPSNCPACGHRLAFFDLIPALSFLLLRGKCRYCKNRISARYLVVELVTAALFFFIYQRYGLTPELVFMLAFAAIIVLITFADLETQIIPDQANYLGLATGLAYNYFSGKIMVSLIGAVSCAVVMYVIYKLGTYFYKKEAMGGGDIKLAAFFGAFFGWQNGLLCLFISFIVGAAAASAYMIFLKKGRRDEIPFAFRAVHDSRCGNNAFLLRKYLAVVPRHVNAGLLISPGIGIIFL